MNEIIQGAEITAQTPEFQEYFKTDLQPKIDFANSCKVRDKHNRPLEWHFDNVIIKAIYFTDNENYNFNKFVCYGTV